MKHKREEGNVALEIDDHLWSVVLPLGSGLALGMVVATALRWRGLRWSWALCGFPLAYLLASLDWQLAFACGLASATATGIGAYWHTQDHYRGGEDARRAREATGPL